MQKEIIKKYFDAANSIVLSEMYLKSYPDNNIEITLDDLKKYNPGHLGSSLSINFILANLYYFLNKNNIKSQLVIGTGHAGASLIANLWLNGTLEKYNESYKQNRQGLDNLVNDFGESIRSEINPLYPETIYDGGELGYSLGVAYGYAINGEADLVPCIIGDGEAECGTICSAWQLAKMLNTKSKVLPIINLNGLKMGSDSFLSRLSDMELVNFFGSLGYDVQIVDSIDDDIYNVISQMQLLLSNILFQKNPLIIFKSLKGYTLSEYDGVKYEGQISVHKNPLIDIDDVKKLEIIKKFLCNYDMNIFDDNGELLPLFNNFKVNSSDNFKKNIIKDVVYRDNIELDEYLYQLIKVNDSYVFSPDEIYSNKFYKCSENVFEILNENLLQALYQGYTQAGNIGFFISYEGFIPIISSMISQYYKYLKQKDVSDYNDCKHSLNYILTSTCWENTYSHQNPDFVNSLLEKRDSYYNVFYPKDVNNAIRCVEEILDTSDKINVLTFSKRHNKIYQSYHEANTWIEVIKDCENPHLILCATGDYMFDYVLDIYDLLKQNYPNIKIVYVTKPQILSVDNEDSLNDREFEFYFNNDIPVIYLFSGYASVIKSLLFDRNIDCIVKGYNDGISVFGNLSNNIKSNEMEKCDIIKVCENKLDLTSKTLKLRR